MLHWAEIKVYSWFYFAIAKSRQIWHFWVCRFNPHWRKIFYWIYYALYYETLQKYQICQFCGITEKHELKQYIPVGCVPTAAVAISVGEGWVSASSPSDQKPSSSDQTPTPSDQWWILGRGRPSVDRMTHACENITFPASLRYAVGNDNPHLSSTRPRPASPLLASRAVGQHPPLFSRCRVRVAGISCRVVAFAVTEMMQNTLWSVGKYLLLCSQSNDKVSCHITSNYRQTWRPS